MGLKIKKRDLKPYVMQWLANKLGLGLSIGDIYYVAASGGLWEANLLENGVPSNEIFSTVTAGEDALTGGQHDVLCVTPGVYDEDATITWDKSHTHMVGLSGPPQHSEWSIPNVSIYTDATDNASVLTVTGHYCQFHNFAVSNYGNNAACLTAVTINGYGNYFSFVDMIGAMLAAQIAVVAASSLYFGADGANSLLEDCNIGSSAWATRTVANSGVIRYTGTAGGGGPSNSTLRRCNINSRAETNTMAMVALPANNCCARGWLYDQCHFNNFWVNHGGTLLSAFYDNCGTTHDITLRNCSAQGIARWYTADNGSLFTIGANSASAGGIAAEATGD